MELTESWRRVLPQEVLDRYDVRETRQAAAVLQSANPDQFAQLVTALNDFELERDDILVPGGNEGTLAKRLNKGFRDQGWREGQFDLHVRGALSLMPYKAVGERVATLIETEARNVGYKVDNVSGNVALDVEWYAKDGNLDRDLAAYRALYEVAIISVGVLITRAHQDIRELSIRLGRADGFKTTTSTNLEKLIPRLGRGDGGGCPILAIAITSRCMRT